jgi:hypothetical protein
VLEDQPRISCMLGNIPLSQPLALVRPFFFHFFLFFWGGGKTGLNSGLCACKAGTT